MSGVLRNTNVGISVVDTDSKNIIERIREALQYIDPSVIWGLE